IIEKYKKYLPVSKKTPVVSLNEGNTPLIYAAHLSGILGKGFEVYLKYEGLNPTGSFKDRGMTMAISKACEEGSRAVICASTGNTSASAAAYAARAGIKCVVLIPSGAIALGKLSQALIHGALVLAVEGNFDDALKLVREIAAKYPITLVNSLNPYRIEGQKTASFEICDALESAPDYQVMPVGNAGNITAYWKGYKEYKKEKKIRSLPKMLGFQAEGAAPIVRGHPIEKPETIATAIRIGNPASWKSAEEARDESGGLIDMVSDDQIIAAYKLLAQEEGVFVEPASAASVAGLLKLDKNKYFKKPGKVVCILTGHGLKDPDRAIKTVKTPKVIKPELGAILKEIGY
ncbi:MAG: threonine synthase, partial [Candidatus Omnitrophica bacterium]|nr:threonine synthase [Candidatus Omnitrophota bacterium]